MAFFTWVFARRWLKSISTLTQCFFFSFSTNLFRPTCWVTIRFTFICFIFDQTNSAFTLICFIFAWITVSIKGASSCWTILIYSAALHYTSTLITKVFHSKSFLALNVIFTFYSSILCCGENG